MHLDLSHMSGVPRSPGFIHTSKTERLDYPNAPDLLSWSQPLPLPKAATTETNCRLANCPLPVPIRAWLTAIREAGSVAPLVHSADSLRGAAIFPPLSNI